MYKDVELLEVPTRGSIQTQGTVGQQPNPAQGMPGGQQPLNRSMLPPNAPGVGSAQTPQPGASHMGHSPSQPASPAPNGVMPSPSPSMSARQPPNMAYNVQSMNQELSEILRMPVDVQQRLRQEAGVGDKDMPSLNAEERVGALRSKVYNRHSPSHTATVVALVESQAGHAQATRSTTGQCRRRPFESGDATATAA